MPRIAASKARNDFADTINRVAYGGERVVLHRRGKDLVAIISPEDLKLLEAIEDKIDVEAAKKARKEKGSIPWEKVKKRLTL